jgi:hypothetical protein
MDRTELAERAGIDLRLLSVILARAQSMKLQSDKTWRETVAMTLTLAQDVACGNTCPQCFGVGKTIKLPNGGSFYVCGCES